MKLGILFISIVLISLTGCYTVVYQSDETETVYEETVYIEPIYIPVPVPVPDPCPMPGPYPHPHPNNPPEKIRHNDQNGNDRNDSYSGRDPIRNSGGRGNEERKIQGR
jgi:hypothetical protein